VWKKRDAPPGGAMKFTAQALSTVVAILCLLSLAACGGGASGQQTNPPPPPPPAVLSIITTSLPAGAVNALYAEPIQATGGVAPFTWSVSVGAPPAGLLLGPSTTSSAIITGTPTTQQTATFTINVTDSSNQSASQTYLVAILPAQPITVSLSPSMFGARVNQTQQFIANVANDPTSSGVSWKLSGCPAGTSDCGNISDSSIANAMYTAPAVLPPPNTTVVITATSIADPSKSASAAITFVSGTLQFSAPTSFPAGVAPTGVVSADFDGDGKLDLAVVDNGNPSVGDSGGVSILLGKGDGTFQAAVSFPAGMNPTAIAVADFNHDGKTDLVVADLGERPTGGNGTIGILLGKGDGTFQAPLILNAGENPFVLATGDFNHDGLVDIAVSNFGHVTPGDAGGVDVLLGNGDGTFQPAVQIAAGPNPVGLVASDFNGDGVLDLAVADLDVPSTTHGGVTILLGKGDGTFQLGAFFVVPDFPTSIAVGHLNGENRESLVVTSYISVFGLSIGCVSVLSGNGDGTFNPAWTLGVRTTGEAGSVFPIFVNVADFDGDGKADVAEIFGSSVAVYLGNGNGTLESQQIFAAGSAPFAMTTGDFNGDGQPDIVFVSQGGNSASVLLNTTTH
jgi:hypothetical protein